MEFYIVNTFLGLRFPNEEIIIFWYETEINIILENYSYI
jgi:hypothetical protein